MAACPTATVTFLFTDIQGSTRLWQTYPVEMKQALARHDAIMRGSIESAGGRVFKTVGDAFCASFQTASDAVESAVRCQLRLRDESWPLPEPILVRMGIHTGEAEVRDEDYFGQAVNRAARLMSIGHGGQIILSLSSAEIVRDSLPAEITLRDLGPQRLKDLARCETAFQIVHPGLRQDFPDLKSLDAFAQNLPLQPTPLIGREQELSRIGALLSDSEVRIVTLTGPGGMGKTRLALQAAADQIEQFKDGVFFVDLSTVHEPGSVMEKIALSIGVQISSEKTAEDELRAVLRRKEMLLVLDNFERLIEASAAVVGILGECTSVKMLFTSREPLAVRGERLFPVPPLTLPEKKQRRAANLRLLSQFEAVRLFVERASAIREGFSVDRENAPAIAQICYDLDGIPLAIELAAARISTLSPTSILKLLDNRLRLLSLGPRDLPERHRTLRAAIEWSFELLDPQLRRIFASISVFQGEFDVRAVAAVHFAQTIDENRALEAVESLVAKSLVVPTTDVAGERRFRVLKTIGEFGLECLETEGKTGETRTRCARYFLAVAEEAEREIVGPSTAAAVARIDADYENFIASLKWFELHEEHDPVRRLSVALWRYWQIRGLYPDGRHWLARALAQDCPADARLHGRAALGAGALASDQGDYEGAAQLLDVARRCAAKAADSECMTEAEYERGYLHYRRGDLEEAHSAFKRTKEFLGASPNESLFARALLGEGLVAWKRGEHQDAGLLFEQGREKFHALGDLRQEAKALLDLGIIAYERNEWETARKWFLQSSEILSSLKDSRMFCNVCFSLGTLHLRAGEYTDAIKCFLQALRILQNSDARRTISEALSGIADAHLGLGNPKEGLVFALKAKGELEGLSEGAELGISLRALGDAHRSVNHETAASECYRKSIRLLELACEKEELERAKEGLAKLSSTRGEVVDHGALA